MFFAKTLVAFVAAFVWLAGIAGNFLQTATQAQRQAAAAHFEEASVRLCDPDHLPDSVEGARGGGPNSFRMTPGRTYALCMTLATLVRTAYGYHPGRLGFVADRNTDMKLDPVYGLGVEDGLRVRGGPDWVRNDHYTIEAVAAGAADADTMRGPMLLSLLERRFQLKAHIETERVPAFALKVATGGLRIKPMADDDCHDPIPDAVIADRERRGLRGPVVLSEARRLGIKPGCRGFTYSQPNGPNMRSELLGPLGNLASALSFDLETKVFDKTGITDKYMLAFEYSPDERATGALKMMAVPPPPSRPGFDASPNAPRALSLSAALDQLGLTLEPTTMPREFVVIDHVERPTQN